MSNDAGTTDLEAFHNSYHYYILSVEALAMEPEATCEKYGHYNVAAELVLECAAGGNYLLNNSACTFTKLQREAVASLAKHLESLPLEATRGTDIKSESLARMRHPAWVPIRAEARALLKALQSATEATVRY